MFVRCGPIRSVASHFLWRAVDDETQRLIELRKIKLDRLHILDKQAAAYGEIDLPPHIAMERSNLRSELGLAQMEKEAVETAIRAPITSTVGDELGPGGRFLVNYQQNREIKQSIASVAVDLERFVKASEEWRTVHRQILIVIGVAVILLVIAVASIVTYIIARGGL